MTREELSLSLTRFSMHRGVIRSNFREEILAHDQAQREDIESLRQDRDIFSSQLQEYSKLLLKRDEEIARLREALKFYADPQTYGIHGGIVNRVIHDAGRVAKAALAKEVTRDKAE